MKLSPDELRKDRLLAVRASHDPELQRVLRSEGVDVRANATPIHVQLRSLAPDQRKRIEEAIPDVEMKTGRSMEVYERAFAQAEQEWAKDQAKLARDAERRLEGQLEAARTALANGREEQFRAIQVQVDRDRAQYEQTFTTSGQIAGYQVMRALDDLAPSLTANDRTRVGTAIMDQRPVPKAALDLNELPQKIEAAEVAHKRALEQEQKREKTPTASPSPTR